MTPLEESNVVKRVRRSLANLLAIAIAMFGIVAVAVPSHSQTPAPNKAAIVESIKKDAKRHIDNDIPIQTEVVVDLYKDNKAGLTAPKIAEIYEEEYSRLKKAKESNLWERLNPSGGWVVAFVLFVVLLFRDALAEWTSNVLKAIGSWVYNRFAGTPLFHKISLKRYRQALRDKYRQLHVPFRPDRPLQMREVYVPLKVAGTNDTEQIDAYEAIAKNRKLMVTGPPGSGKSMLLKHIALSYAEDRLLEAEKPIAIFLELHRLSDPQKPLKQHLVEALARDHFPNAERFVSQGLERGKLMLLLDGLDEVNSRERPRVVLEIRDLLDYLDEHRCRVIITCRTAIYEGQFDDRVERRLQVVEFNDREIRQFLGAWASSMPANKSIEQLMQTLRDRPRIMALARNPLLLTIIAYLFCDTAFVLPHSRADFYQKATDILLDVWHKEHNHYLARDKRSVLQHLALYFQQNAERQQQDRRSVDHKQTLAQVKEALPDLGLNPDDDAKPLLKEIVERSGLLLEIDRGDRYQFAHLTLQEFFAAAELRGNANELVERFEKDPGAWREAAKLWCGLAEDSTTAIQSIYARDPITAFECLADARKVQQALATEITNYFKERLSVANEDDRLARAFAAVAADRRLRGRAAFQLLKETLADNDPARRAAAAKALSLTNLPDAAKVLARNYSEQPEMREHLVRMGDLAVSVLVGLYAQGLETAMDALLAIGTPDAAKALLPLLWDTDYNLAARAAWRLAALLPEPNVEEVLRNYPIAEEQRRANWIDWIWQPFEEPADSALPVITGRLAYLMTSSPVAEALAGFEEQPKLDPRIVIPLCAIETVREIDLSDYEILKQALARLEKHQNSLSFSQAQAEFVGEIITRASSRWCYLLSSLSVDLQNDLLYRLITGRLPVPYDWIYLFQNQIKYNLKRTWEFWALVAVCASICIMVILQLTSNDLQAYLSTFNLTEYLSKSQLLIAKLLASTVKIIGSYETAKRAYFLLSKTIIFLWVAIGLSLPLVMALIQYTGSNLYIFFGMPLLLLCFSPIMSALPIMLILLSLEVIQKTVRTLLILLGLVLLPLWVCFAISAIFFTPSIIYLSTVSAIGLWHWQYGLAMWSILTVLITSLWLISARKENKARNPLQGILEPTPAANSGARLNNKVFSLLTPLLRRTSLKLLAAVPPQKKRR